jgi:signal recognition particle subunit SRP19
VLAERMAPGPDAVDPEVYAKWQILYPNYIDSTKNLFMGRRIAVANGVEHPNVREMADVCEVLKIPCVIEDKSYSRDWLVRGRVRVMLKNPDGTFVHNEVQTKKQIMLKMSELIPKLKHRVNPPKEAADKKESKKEKKKGKK